MSRTQGAKNILHLADRKLLATLPREEVGHLSDATAPQDELRYVVTNQANLRTWLKRKDTQLKTLAKAVETGSKKKVRGPRDGTTTKYDWYLSHLLSLELMGGLEFFFKTTMIALADALGSTLDRKTSPRPVATASGRRDLLARA